MIDLAAIAANSGWMALLFTAGMVQGKPMKVGQNEAVGAGGCPLLLLCFSLFL